MFIFIMRDQGVRNELYFKVQSCGGSNNCSSSSSGTGSSTTTAAATISISTSTILQIDEVLGDVSNSVFCSQPPRRVASTTSTTTTTTTRAAVPYENLAGGKWGP